MKNRLLLVFLLTNVFNAFSQSTSPNPDPNLQVLNTIQALPVNSSKIITFSEFGVGTAITNQYKDIGIIFDSGPFISNDRSNPTSPVLSGTPRFEGPITGRFVAPGTDKSVVVKSFTFDAGYFDDFGSTRIEWFDSKGNKLGQQINSRLGIEQFTIEGGNIASFTISIVANEPAGYAIDNISFVPIGTSIVFRENTGDRKEGTWGFLKDEIPGFDHTAFHIENKVYESHPGYSPTTYVSDDGKEKVDMASISGIQSQHTLATFKHDAPVGVPSPVTVFEEIPIDETLANNMRTSIETMRGRTFHFIDFSSLDGILKTLAPNAQKGGGADLGFTCVGLVEWAAEQSGYNGGQGFISNKFESLITKDPREPLNSAKQIEVPLLSPELLNYAIKNQQLVADGKQWIHGLFDPVDFVITDPLGRRLGFIQGIGSYKEIPYAFYPGNGKVEQFLIPQVVPGVYKIKLLGKGEFAFAAFGSKESSDAFSGMLTQGQTEEKTILVKPTIGCIGDVNVDGAVDSKDITALSQKLNRFTDGLGDPGDIDGNGLLSNVDLELLKKLVGILNTPTITINPVIPNAVCSGSLFSLTAIAAGFTPTNYTWSSIPAGFSSSGASLTAFTQSAPAVSSSTTYTITVTATSNVSSVTANVAVLVNALPTAKLVNNGPLSCNNSTVTLTATGGTTYLFSSGAIQNGNQSSNTATVTQTGLYSVTVVSQHGCTAVASTSVTSSSDLPDVPILAASMISSVNQPISVTATNCSGTINWNLTGGIGTANGNIYTLTNPGNYTLSASCTIGSCTSPLTSLFLTINSSPSGGLTLLAPTYNCSTGAFTFNTTGGDGSPITFYAIGITGSTTNPNQFVDVELRTVADAAPITLYATQNGVTTTYVWDIRAACPVTPGGSTLTLLAPTYNCNTGAFTFNTSGGNGSPISFYAIGITGPTTNPNQFVDMGIRTAADAKPITLYATQNGVTVSYVWDIRAVCPITPGGSALTLLAPTYNCSTGAFTFNTSGGNGSTIEYRAVPGITDWTTNPNQFVDIESRNASDVQPFLLQARQGGVVTTLVWDLKAACGRARLGSAEATARMGVTVLGNPIAGETVNVEVNGVDGQPVHFQLTNLQGQLISEHDVRQATSAERVQLQLSKSAGVYLLQVSSPNQVKVVRVLKVR